MDNWQKSLAAALELEHRQVDDGLAVFLTELDNGRVAADHLNTALEALRRHIYAEERILFPPIRHGPMAMPVAVMMCEHGEIWRAMNALAELAGAGDINRMRVAGQRLLDQLATHNDKEEQVIYPAADSELEPEQAEELADFLETGLMPDCWECREAG
ncbi:hemerythrin domain-containing protein [[Mycobacterium] nativiensis]|uniref:Hemerythrin domain-containing protein n=1 Tax=[Mycobacterium] nativiensis TaxID=2855503 RepID=A0ABU5XS33_9MYCO|nr:hemerythrin domain-containing protein [Mycolicibacter sp. MYC340]MEB3030779.1 hemerythrin domain-containing protein [Mycolicibacter sp. MYC340]